MLHPIETNLTDFRALSDHRVLSSQVCSCLFLCQAMCVCHCNYIWSGGRCVRFASLGGNWFKWEYRVNWVHFDTWIWYSKTPHIRKHVWACVRVCTCACATLPLMCQRLINSCWLITTVTRLNTDHHCMYVCFCVCLCVHTCKHTQVINTITRLNTACACVCVCVVWVHVCALALALKIPARHCVWSLHNTWECG